MIVADIQALQSAAHADRGIGRFVFDLAHALLEGHPDAVDLWAWNDRLPRTPQLDAFAALGLGDRLVPFSELAGRAVAVLHVHSPFELLDHAVVDVPVDARRLVATCYDLIPYRFADRYLVDPSFSVRYRSRLGLLAAADAIVADSRSAADDLVELLDADRRRVTVIGAGVGDRFRPSTEPLAARWDRLRAAVPGIEPRFVLVPTGADWRKNTDGAIAAFGRLPAELRARHQLVLSCAADDAFRALIAGWAEAADVADRVLVTGHVPDDVLVQLYQCAELVFFPSFYEGFGLPVLEARRCGARVICSGVSSLPEVLPEPRALFDPWDLADVTRRLESALTDPATAAVLDAIPDPGFTWADAARRVARVYAELERSA